MKFIRLNGDKEQNVNIQKYLINWDKKVSAPQQKTKDFLRPYWSRFIVLEEFRIPGSLFRCDLMNLTTRTIVEVSPSGSHSFNPFFHHTRSTGFIRTVKSDIQKQEWAEKNKFQLVSLGDVELKNLTKEMFKTQFDIDL